MTRSPVRAAQGDVVRLKADESNALAGKENERMNEKRTQGGVSQSVGTDIYNEGKKKIKKKKRTLKKS